MIGYAAEPAAYCGHGQIKKFDCKRANKYRNQHPRHTMSYLRSGVEVFEIYGSLFFGAIERFKVAMRSVEKRPRVLILRMRQVQTIDASGLHSMNELLESTARRNIALVISAVRPNVRHLMDQAGFAQALGPENFVTTSSWRQIERKN